jgi:hypothetical protein
MAVIIVIYQDMIGQTDTSWGPGRPPKCLVPSWTRGSLSKNGIRVPFGAPSVATEE